MRTLKHLRDMPIAPAVFNMKHNRVTFGVIYDIAIFGTSRADLMVLPPTHALVTPSLLTYYRLCKHVYVYRFRYSRILLFQP